LGEIPEHWDVKKLKHITSKVTDGSHFSPPTESEGRFYISVTDITKSNSINFENSKRISDNSFEELARNGCKPIKGDILITKDGTIGRGVIVEDFDDFVILSSLGLIRLNNKQNPYYILFYLLSGLNIDQMYSNIRGSGITRLTIKLINDLIVVVPSFEEQIEIENYLKLKTIEIDKVIIKSKQEIELLKEYKTALISEVVTGKVDVRGEKLN
jgi:type I restriction enzyme S subunit